MRDASTVADLVQRPKCQEEVESYSKTYDGSYENFQKFSKELKILLKNKSSIGEYILKSTIAVEKKKRGFKNSYKQKGRLITSQTDKEVVF